MNIQNCGQIDDDCEMGASECVTQQISTQNWAHATFGLTTRKMLSFSYVLHSAFECDSFNFNTFSLSGKPVKPLRISKKSGANWRAIGMHKTWAFREMNVKFEFTSFHFLWSVSQWCNSWLHLFSHFLLHQKVFAARLVNSHKVWAGQSYIANIYNCRPPHTKHTHLGGVCIFNGVFSNLEASTHFFWHF